MTKIKSLKVKISKLQRRILSLEKKEKIARDRWTREYNKFIKASKDLATIKKHGTKKEEVLKNIVLNWDERTVLLTINRDEIRNKIASIKEEINSLKTKRVELVKDFESQTREVDDKINQIFAANTVVISALDSRDSFLETHIYPNLIDDNGKLCSQVTLLSSDKNRKVVVLTNTIHIIDPKLASLAQKKIQDFFGIFKEKIESDMNKETKLLYKIVSELLIERKSFKPGQYLYQFLSTNIDEKDFPELCEAQTLLKRSLGSKKSGAYIKLYEKSGIKNSFKPIRTK